MIHRLTIDAFAESSATSAALRDAQASRELSKCQFTLMKGGLSAAAFHYAEQATPQVIIVEDNDPATMIGRLEQLAEVCDPNTKVMVIGGVNDIQLYRSLIARGVSEYLPCPVTSQQILDALTSLFSDPKTAPRGRVIACWGARGGVGSSTLAQNIAWNIGQYLQEGVVYIDLDISFGTSMLAYNIEARQTVADALMHAERLDDVLMGRCMVEYDDTLQILASAGDCRTDVALSPEGIEHLIDLAQRMSSVVVVDVPHVWSDWVRHVLVAADEVVLTAVPDFASLRDAKTALDTLGQTRKGATPPKLVLNKVDVSKKAQLTGKDFQTTLGATIMLTIPYDPQLFSEAANTGQMIGETAKSHKTAQALAGFAASIAGKTPASRKTATAGLGGLLQWLRK